MFVDVCYTPALFPFIDKHSDTIYVVVDILRATTSMCMAFHNGAYAIIPFASIEDVLKYKLENKGVFCAGERECKQIDGFDFGNSPYDFVAEKVAEQTIAYTTTNGTLAIETAAPYGTVVLGAFVNIDALTHWLYEQKKNIVIFCSGWKNTFSLEDATFAGALAEKLICKGNYISNSDAVLSSINLWEKAKSHPLNFLQEAIHYKRLTKIYLKEEIDFCFKLNQTVAIPLLIKNTLKNINYLSVIF